MDPKTAGTPAKVGGSAAPNMLSHLPSKTRSHFKAPEGQYSVVQEVQNTPTKSGTRGLRLSFHVEKGSSGLVVRLFSSVGYSTFFHTIRRGADNSQKKEREAEVKSKKEEGPPKSQHWKIHPAVHGRIHKSTIKSIKWVPSFKNLFLCGFADGQILLMDVKRDDSSHFGQVIRDNKRQTVLRQPDPHLNPVACWNVSKSAINAMSFSPDGKSLAVASGDGYLRVFDYESEELLCAFRSYYGGLHCVCWSPDGVYIAAGGEDDLATIWSFVDKRIVCRCEGHSSWVSSVAFDPLNCSGQVYRLATTGQDARLCLWDFSVDNLRRPRSRSQLKQSDQQGDAEPTIQASAPSRHTVPILVPQASTNIHGEPLSSVAFIDDLIATACWDGMIKFWKRPSATKAKE